MSDVLTEYRAVKTTPIPHRTNGQSAEHKKPHCNTEEYKKMYEQSINDPTAFWDKASQARAVGEQAQVGVGLCWGTGKGPNSPTKNLSPAPAWSD